MDSDGYDVRRTVHHRVHRALDTGYIKRRFDIDEAYKENV